MQLTGHDNNMNTWTSATYGGGWLSVFVGLTFENWLALVGSIVLILTFLTNLYFKLRSEAREQELHELKRVRLKSGEKLKDEDE